jgi:hypothetical protein
VFDADGNVTLALTLYGFPKPDGPGGVDAYIERTCEAGQRATMRLGGRVPVSK